MHLVVNEADIVLFARKNESLKTRGLIQFKYTNLTTPIFFDISFARAVDCSRNELGIHRSLVQFRL